RGSPGFLEIRHPEVEAIPPIPKCNEDMYIANDQPCQELAYSPDNSVTREIMDNVVSRNGKPISARAFPTREAVQDFLFDNPDFIIGAVHFVFDNLPTNITLDLGNRTQEQIEQFLPPGVDIPDDPNQDQVEQFLPPGVDIPDDPNQDQIEEFLPPGVDIPDNLTDLNFTLPPFPAQLPEQFPDLPDGLQEVISNLPDELQRAIADAASSPDTNLQEVISDITSPPGSNTGRRLEQQFTLPEDEEDFTLEELQKQLNQTRGLVSALQGFIIQTNTTMKSFKGEFQHPNAFVQVPLQNAVHREVARYHLKLRNKNDAAEALEWNVGFKPFPSPALDSEGVLRQILGPFVFAALMFSFVIQISSVVIEKELKLRQALRTMGMSDMAYWTSWGAWEVTLAFVQGHLVAIFGLILQFNIFHDNNYGLLFFLFFLFQLAMSSFALFLSAFLTKTQAAVYLGFVIFIVGWIMQAVVVFGVPYSPDFYMKDPLGEALTIIFSIFPWSPLVKGFNDLGMATTQDYR
ncbi:ABC-2 family transporter protein-domain-containing protein, partial [Dunaliella salina]